MPGGAATRREDVALRQRLRPAVARPARPGAAVPDPGGQPDLRFAGVSRSRLRARARACRVVAAARAEALALQASPGREVSRTSVVHCGRMRFLHRARAAQEL